MLNLLCALLYFIVALLAVCKKSFSGLISRSTTRLPNDRIGTTSQSSLGFFVGASCGKIETRPYVRLALRLHPVHLTWRECEDTKRVSVSFA